MFKHVIAGVDEHQGGRDAIALAKLLVAEDGELTLAFVYLGDPTPVRESSGAFEAAERERGLELLATARDEAGVEARFERLSLERAQEIAREGQELARELGLAVDTRTERNGSSVWQMILGVADEIDAELIVIGTHGATAVQSLLLGSVSNALVHHSKRPVLVVPAEARFEPGTRIVARAPRLRTLGC
jgi:nucleotide-binding universal stress UspA family protein